jgi:hypothetical protein
MTGILDADLLTTGSLEPADSMVPFLVRAHAASGRAPSS